MKQITMTSNKEHHLLNNLDSIKQM